MVHLGKIRIIESRGIGDEQPTARRNDTGEFSNHLLDVVDMVEQPAGGYRVGRATSERQTGGIGTNIVNTVAEILPVNVDADGKGRSEPG